MVFSNSDAKDWFRRFSMFPTRFGWFGQDDPFAEIGKIFRNNFRDIEGKIPKDLVREYETAKGEKIRELGPLVYGYSMMIGPDGKPRVQEFGNIKQPLVGVRFKGWLPVRYWWQFCLATHVMQ